MNHYMKALHQRFFRKPDVSQLEQEIETARQEVRDCLDKVQRRKLMDLVDGQALLRETISLASFTAGFQLAWGIANELEAEGLYSCDEETEGLCYHTQKEDRCHGKTQSIRGRHGTQAGEWPLGGPHGHRPQGKR